MKIVGLTGPTGSGKSTIASRAAEKGISVIDCDKVAHKVTEKGKPVIAKLMKAFGEEIVAKDGSLIRKKLAEKAFSSEENTLKLNSILLPVIVDEISKKIQLLKAESIQYVLLDAPTLYESGIDCICDEVIAVLCSSDIRKDRIIKRDKLTENQAIIRLSASKPDLFYKSRTNHIIVNDGNITEFLQNVDFLLGELFK